MKRRQLKRYGGSQAVVMVVGRPDRHVRPMQAMTRWIVALDPRVLRLAVLLIRDRPISALPVIALPVIAPLVVAPMVIVRPVVPMPPVI